MECNYAEPTRPMTSWKALSAHEIDDYQDLIHVFIMPSPITDETSLFVIIFLCEKITIPFLHRWKSSNGTKGSLPVQ